MKDDAFTPQLGNYLAAIIATRAYVSARYVELRMVPFWPKFLHRRYGGEYYQIGEGVKTRGRTRLYGKLAQKLLEDLEPYFLGPDGVRIRGVLRRMQQGKKTAKTQAKPGVPVRL